MSDDHIPYQLHFSGEPASALDEQLQDAPIGEHVALLEQALNEIDADLAALDTGDAGANGLASGGPTTDQSQG